MLEEYPCDRNGKTVRKEQRQATKEEQNILSDYVGWGGIADVFDVKKPQWQEERERIQTALTPEEYRSAEEFRVKCPFYTARYY